MRAAGVIVPEVFSAAVGQALPMLERQLAGPRIALFHDALALQLPEFAPPGTVARFPAYLKELAGFDGVAAVSEPARAALARYWDWLGLSRTPALTAIPLGIEPPRNPAPDGAGGSAAAIVLCVGTLEARKNHLALLEACESLWDRGLRFELRLIGMARPRAAAAVLAKIAALQGAGKRVRYDGPQDESALEKAYAEAAFTVYPSLAEGFGLPVAESLIRGKPCVCSAAGAVGEIAALGGCVPLAELTARAIALACERLLVDGAERERLSAAARARRFKTPAEYADELLAWTKTLPMPRS